MTTATDRATKVLTLRLPEDEYDALRGYAFVTDTSMNEVMRRALLDFLGSSGRREEAEAFFQKFSRQYAVALDKLADL